MWPFVTHTHVLILLYTHTHMHAHTIIVKIFILYFGGKRQTIIVCGGAGSSAIRICVLRFPSNACVIADHSFWSASFCFPFLGSNLFICHYESPSPVLSRVFPRTHACPVSCGGCHNMGAMVCPATTRTHIHALNLQVKLGSLPEDIILPYGLHYNTRKYV